MSKPWVGRSPTGGQLRQRGCCSTLPASANRARERSARSPIALKLSALRKSSANAHEPAQMVRIHSAVALVAVAVRITCPPTIAHREHTRVTDFLQEQRHAHHA